MRLDIATAAFILTCQWVSIGWAQGPESHQMHVRAQVSYRCYPGYDERSVMDDQTRKACDNKTYKKVVSDKIIQVHLSNEAGKDLEGSWTESFIFKERKFKIAVNLVKSTSARPYHLSIVTKDDSLSTRQSTVSTDLKTMRDFNPISTEYSSQGRREEFHIEVLFEPAPKN